MKNIKLTKGTIEKHSTVKDDPTMCHVSSSHKIKFFKSCAPSTTHHAHESVLNRQKLSGTFKRNATDGPVHI